MAFFVPPVPQPRYSDVLFDPEQIAGIGSDLQESMDRRRQRAIERRTQEAFRGGIPTRADGSPDYAAMAARLFEGGDIDSGFGMTRLAETQAQNSWERSQPQYWNMGESLLRAAPGSDPEVVYEEPPEPEKPVLGDVYSEETGQPQKALITPSTGDYKPIGGPKAPSRPTLTATDKKAIMEAEDENANLVGTIESLTRAKELNEIAYSGFGAGARGSIGARLPDVMVPDAVADPRRSQATVEWQTIMSPEALSLMSATLKGTTTDFELRKFEGILADPSTPPEIRTRTINRMIELAKRKQQINNTRMQELRGGTYYNADGTSDLIAGPEEPNQQLPPGWSQEEWDALTDEEKAMFAQ